MRHYLTHAAGCLLMLCMLLAATAAMSQKTVSHKVKKNETIYGIARQYGITEEQLRQANPGMEQPGYKLKKGDVIQVPVADGGTPQTTAGAPGHSIRLGVMLPLHDRSNDGRRMVEYYRGVLMACDSLKHEGLSVDVHAWNTADDAGMKAALQDPAAAGCDLIIGPLYSKQMAVLSEFVEQHGILLAVPFSINAPQLYHNRNIFQVYQTPNDLTETTVRRCVDWFKDYHPIIVDCGDSTSTKGSFTATFRRLLEVRDIRYSLTSLHSGTDNFVRAFQPGRKNLVVLNTSRLADLQATLSLLKTVSVASPTAGISVFGYTEWLMYAQKQEAAFHQFDVYVPTPYYANMDSAPAARLQWQYRRHFGQDMMQALPRFALTGYDHAMFFLRGLHRYGKAFDGAAGRLDHQPVQTPLKFERMGNGGLQNRSYMFVHYKPDHTLETINY